MTAAAPLLDWADRKRKRKRAPAAPKVRPKEIALHMAVAGILRRFARPEWRWAHYPAGELRDARTAGKLRAMGTQAGWPDFLFIAPTGLMHALELKRIGENLTEPQAAFATWCQVQGVPHAVCRTMDEVLAVLDRWGCLRIMLSGPNAR